MRYCPEFLKREKYRQPHSIDHSLLYNIQDDMSLTIFDTSCARASYALVTARSQVKADNFSTAIYMLDSVLSTQSQIHNQHSHTAFTYSVPNQRSHTAFQISVHIQRSKSAFTYSVPIHSFVN
ncbi:hypothetical protein ACJMK2_035567 [Sinanodonta woodiana]|uniref:Uncharacterized protein n=1 Tax=Sinanodonta woodiana TaxID=1069815 RepID=A0ABD3WVB8_SINWO